MFLLPRKADSSLSLVESHETKSRMPLNWEVAGEPDMCGTNAYCLRRSDTCAVGSLYKGRSSVDGTCGQVSAARLCPELLPLSTFEDDQWRDQSVGSSESTGLPSSRDGSDGTSSTTLSAVNNTTGSETASSWRDWLLTSRTGHNGHMVSGTVAEATGEVARATVIRFTSHKMVGYNDIVQRQMVGYKDWRLWLDEAEADTKRDRLDCLEGACGQGHRQHGALPMGRLGAKPVDSSTRSGIDSVTDIATLAPRPEPSPVDVCDEFWERPMTYRLGSKPTAREAYDLASGEDRTADTCGGSAQQKEQLEDATVKKNLQAYTHSRQKSDPAVVWFSGR